MRLSAEDIAHRARRATAVFAAFRFEARRGRGADRHRAERRRASRACCALSPAFCRSQAGAFALEGGDPGASARRAGALSRPCRRAEGRADGGREPRLLGRRARRRFAPRGVAARRSARLGLAHVVDFPVPRALGRPEAARRARAAARRASPAVAARRADDRARRRRAGAFAEIMREHLAGGGLIVAATHAPLGLDAGVELGARQRVRIRCGVDAASIGAAHG